MNLLKKINIRAILILALLLRLIFILFLAKIYFGRPTIYVDGDTMGWVRSFINWWEHGVYSADLTDPMGYFNKAPAYSFFIGFFYLLSGKNLQLTFPLVAYAQLILDVASVWLIYKIVLKTAAKQQLALIAAFLYSIYPFILVWVPVVYAEQLSVFLMLAGLYFIYVKDKKIVAGVCFALGALCRFQITLLVPALFLVELFSTSIWKEKLKFWVLIGLSFTLVYGLWPARNYFQYHQFVVFQNGSSNNENACYTPEVLSFLKYMVTMQTDVEPQFTQILHNDSLIEFPAIAYTCAADSQLLKRGVMLMKTNCTGVSNFKGYWKAEVKGENSNAETSAIFDTLVAHQIKANPARVYGYVTLLILKKEFFKLNLINKTGMIAILTAILFLFRSLLLLMGIAGLFFIKNEAKPFINLSRVVFLFLCFWYLVLALFFRDTEMRYLLQNDVLMLIPAALFIYFICKKLNLIKPE